jgi:hypothetical protein
VKKEIEMNDVNGRKLPKYVHAFDIYEKDGTVFRGPAHHHIIDEVRLPGGGWKRYYGDGNKVRRSDLVRTVYLDADGKAVMVEPAPERR